MIKVQHPVGDNRGPIPKNTRTDVPWCFQLRDRARRFASAWSCPRQGRTVDNPDTQSDLLKGSGGRIFYWSEEKVEIEIYLTAEILSLYRHEILLMNSQEFQIAANMISFSLVYSRHRIRMIHSSFHSYICFIDPPNSIYVSTPTNQLYPSRGPAAGLFPFVSVALVTYPFGMTALICRENKINK